MQRKYCSSGNKSLTLVILGLSQQTQNEVDLVLDKSKYNDEEEKKVFSIDVRKKMEMVLL